MDSAAPFARVWLLALCCLGAAQSGCARLQSWRRPDPSDTMLGKVSSGVDGAMGQTSGQRRDLAMPPVEMARRTTEDASGSASGRPAERPVSVTLQPPRSVQTTAEGPGNSRPSLPAGSIMAAAEPQPPRRPRPSKTKSEQATEAMAKLVAESRSRLDALASYQVLLTRQERVAGTLLPSEQVLLSIRRQPQAVRIEWPDGPHKGREVIYAADQNGGLLQVNMADSVVPVPRLSIPTDSPMALSRSRHPITEAGLDTIVSRLENSLKLYQAGDPSVGRLTYGGLETPPEVEHACHKITQAKPDGETWVVYLDSQSLLPSLVQASDPSGAVLEKYAFRNLQPNVAELTTAAAFDADRRWGQSSSLLSRLARSTTASDSKPAQTPPR